MFRGLVASFPPDVHLSLILSTSVKCSYLPPNHGEPCDKVGRICHSSREVSVAWESGPGFWFYVRLLQDGQLPEGRGFCLFCSLFWAQNLELRWPQRCWADVFVFVLERVAESFRKCTLMFRSMGDMGQGRGREAQWKPSLRETTIESWDGKGSHGTLFISSRSASI